ncbi:hypothetical protein F8388_003588 [Cannabis sativa]|uniref:PGG domain-containing protein n=1 Tax=Cannabis sativa TaxID=3483 RepID=A0A7J6EMK8_CANSA|nr:hypothetical protein F8388_003588 [Cannabis sativa]
MEMSQSSIPQNFTSCQALLPKNSIKSEISEMKSISIEDGECSNDEKILNFFNAVKSDDIDQIQNLLSSSPNLNLTETDNKDNGDTPLHVAVMLGNFEVVKLIVDNMNINLLRKPNKTRNTVLHEAVKNLNLDIVQFLLEKDSSLVNSNNEDGESPLFLAIDRELYEIASHILGKIENVGGILLDEKGSWSGRNGLNVMHAAVIRNKGKNPKIKGDGVIEKLLEKYGNNILEGKDEHGWTPLHYAAHLNEFHLVNKFLSKHSLICCIQDNKGMSPLHIAAKNDSIKALQSLKNGSGLYRYKMFELLDKKNRTALHVAVKSKHTSLVERMLSFKECNYIINWKDKDGNTCFHLAALTGSSIMVSVFFNYGHCGVLDKIVDLIRDLRCYKTSLESVHDVNGDKPKEKEEEKEMVVSFEHKQQQCNINIGERGLHFSNEIVNVNLIVATIVASITFAAGIQIPGGFNDEGMAVLQEQSWFKFFITFNSSSFGLSSASVLLTFVSVLYNTTVKRQFPKSTSLYFLPIVICLTIGSIASSIVAYMFSTRATMPLETKYPPWKFAFYAGGIALLWRNGSYVNLLRYTSNYVYVEIVFLEQGVWRLTGFYGSLVRNLNSVS